MDDAISFSPLHNHLLIAMPTLMDETFYRAVIFVCEHTREGASGIIINQPLELSLGELFERMDISPSSELTPDLPILLGGPLHPERGFVLHQDKTLWRSTFVIEDNIAITTSRDILESMAKGEHYHHTLVTLGYAGWSAGQLEEEIRNNCWLIAPATPDILFDTPFGQRWKAAAGLLGIDINTISGFSGHG
ncbi:MAG: YqgE/AlgH family protein [Gammaproteobacteria bacterium]|nr:YqgE/AlgH family protein [Gammaproteobacteria bacterium]